MPSKYESQEEKISSFFKEKILPALKKQDLDYNKVVNLISVELGVKEEKIKQTISKFIKLGEVKELHTLTIPDDQVDDWLKDLSKTEKEIQDEIQGVGLHGKG